MSDDRSKVMFDDSRKFSYTQKMPSYKTTIKRATNRFLISTNGYSTIDFRTIKLKQVVEKQSIAANVIAMMGIVRYFYYRMIQEWENGNSFKRSLIRCLKDEPIKEAIVRCGTPQVGFIEVLL